MEICFSTFMIFFFILSLVFVLLMKYFDGPLTHLTHSMKGQTIVVTGGDSHIGWETVKDLLIQGARVILACRNEKHSKELIDSLPTDEQKKRAHYIHLDLTHFDSILNFVKELKETVGKIDILVNNAGTCFQNVELTDGLEKTFSTNYAGHVLLTALLLDDINQKGRIINVTTTKYRRISQSQFDKWVSDDNLNWSYHRYVDDWMKIYVFSKFCNLLHTIYLKDYIEKHQLNMKTCVVHPGFVKNNFFECIHTPYWYFRTAVMYPIRKLFFKSFKIGAQTHLHACYYDYDNLSNASFFKDCQLKKLLRTASSENANRLMIYTKKLFEINDIAKNNELVEKFFTN